MNFQSFRPRFMLARLRQNRFAKRFPDTPWLTEASIRILDSWLKPTDICIEWGSGRSTLWIAQRVARILSVEENPQWHAKVTAMLHEKELAANVDYQLIPCALGTFGEPQEIDYASAAEKFADNSIDFALVDGAVRLTCMRIAMRKLKPGGLLALDNANRFLPNYSLGVASTVHEPRSEYKTPAWKKLDEDLHSWRYLLTTDRVWNTVFWVKPPV